jgi:serine/threonine protein kinase
VDVDTHFSSECTPAYAPPEYFSLRNGLPAGLPSEPPWKQAFREAMPHTFSAAKFDVWTMGLVLYQVLGGGGLGCDLPWEEARLGDPSFEKYLEHDLLPCERWKTLCPAAGRPGAGARERSSSGASGGGGGAGAAAATAAPDPLLLPCQRKASLLVLSRARALGERLMREGASGGLSGGGGSARDAGSGSGEEGEKGKRLLAWLDARKPTGAQYDPGNVEAKVRSICGPEYAEELKRRVMGGASDIDLLQKGHHDGSASLNPLTLGLLKRLLAVDPKKRPQMKEALEELRKLEAHLWMLEGRAPLLEVVTPVSGDGTASSLLVSSGKEGKESLNKCWKAFANSLKSEADKSRLRAVSGEHDLGAKWGVDKVVPLTKAIKSSRIILGGGEPADRLWVLEGVMHEYLREGGIFDVYLAEQHKGFDKVPQERGAPGRAEAKSVDIWGAALTRGQ